MSADRLDASVVFGYGGCEVDAWSTQPVLFDRRTAPGVAAGSRRRAARRRAAAIARCPRPGGLAVGPHANGLRGERAPRPGVGAGRRRLARRGRGPDLPAARQRDARRPLGHRLVRAARQRRLRRRSSRDLPRAARGRAPRRDDRARSATGASACCRRSGCARYARIAALGDGRRRSRPLRSRRRRRCSTRCSPTQPAVALRRGASRACATSSRASTASRRVDAAAVVRAARCATTSATRSAGSRSCGAFGFGGCLADDMGLGKTVRCWRCSRRGASSASATDAAAPVARRRAAVAGLQLDAGGRALRAGADACSTTPAPSGATRSSVCASTTWC